MSRAPSKRPESSRVSAFQQAPLPMILAGTEGAITDLNQAAETLFGSKGDIPPPVRKLVADVIGSARAGNPSAGVVELGTAGGHVIPFEAAVNPLDQDQWLVSFRDISERLRAQEREKQLNAQFLRAQRMESIGILASGLAHDLNNILSPILMSVPLLRFDLTKSERESTLETIESSSQRAAEIVRQLLTFGRGQSTDQVRVQPRHMIKDVVRIARETFPKEITITSEVSRDLLAVRGDPTQLHQVLMNLCVNARDAMAEHGGILSIIAKNVDVDEQFACMHEGAVAGRYIQIAVEDSGPGIPKDVLDRIFEPFFSTKRTDQGTGLGLPTARDIIMRHGGFMTVQTKLGKGTCFSVYLRALASSEAEAEHVPQTPKLPKGKGEKILIVDDEEQILRVTRKTLEANGYEVMTASDGAEALAHVAQSAGTIKAVITDLLMPFMDGLAFTRAVKRLDPAIIVIASTGQHLDTRLQLVSEAGATVFLNKPYSAEMLLTTLAAALHPNG